MEEYVKLNKTHNWKISQKPFTKIESYIGNLRDGVSIAFEIDNKYGDVYVFFANNKLGQKNGFSFVYLNGNLLIIEQYTNGVKNGIYLKMSHNYPSFLEIYTDGKAIGSVGFWEDGRIRSVKFGSKYYNKSGTGHNYTYDNGQKAFEYIVDHGIKYWIVYDPQGRILIKYPIDNDFCKAEFYNNGQKVKIPYYFDQKEFNEIYEKIKNDANKTKRKDQ